VKNLKNKILDSLIRKISAYVPLTDEDVEIIHSLFKVKQLKKKEYFLQEGGIARYVGFLESGIVRYFIDVDGVCKTYEFGREGDFFSEYESFIGLVPSTKNIQALEDCTYYEIGRADLDKLYGLLSQGERLGRLIIEQLFIDGMKKQASLYADGPEERYLKFRAMYPDLEQRVSQYHIANFVGVEPSSLSRIRRRMVGSK